MTITRLGQLYNDDGSPQCRIRRVAIPASAPNTTQTLGTGLDLTQRTLITLPANATRYRFCFANQNLRAPGSLTAAATITGIWSGSPVYPSTILTTQGNVTQNRWAGDITGTPEQISTALTVPTDGSTIKSGWVTSNTAALSKGTPRAFSWGLTTTTGTIGGGGAGSTGMQGVSATGASNASGATLTSPSIGATTIYLAVWLEVETSNGLPVALVLTDSIGIGYSVEGPGGFNPSNAGCQPCENWPVLAGLVGGFFVTNLGVGSATPADFTNTSNLIWTRYDYSVDVPDFAVISLGTNGIGSPGQQSQETSITTIITNLRAVGVQRIYLTPVLPRNDFSSLYGQIPAGASAIATATTIQSTVNTGNTTIRIGNGYNTEAATVTGVAGAGPYVLTLSAGLTNSHGSGEPIASGNEASRRGFNHWIRQLPYGITGILDHARMVEAFPDAASLDSRWASSDGLHLMRPAQSFIAQQVASSGAGYTP